MKDIRVLGIDDSYFKPHTTGAVLLVGVVMRTSLYIDGFVKDSIEIDGTDVTDAVLRVLGGKYASDIRVIMASGITFGGFNILDIEKIYRETGTKVIIITRKMPDFESIMSALRQNFSDWRWRAKLVRAVPVEKIVNGEHELYIQRVGMSMEEAAELIKKLTVRGAMPEPVRIAHLCATALHFGESRGKP